MMVTRKSKVLWLMLVTGLLVWVGRTFYISEEGVSDDHQTELINMQQINDSLDQEVQYLEEVNRELKGQADSLVFLLAENQNQVKTLKTQKNEAIEIMDSYDGDGLYGFFSKLDTLGTTGK